MKTHVMKTILILFVLSSVSAFADAPPWTGSGTYTFDDTDDYFNHSGIFDTATVNIIGGAFNSLYSYNKSRIYMSGGAGDFIATSDYSRLYLSGGSINYLGAGGGRIDIYVSDYLVTQGTYYYNLTGHWENGNDFDILINDFSWPYVVINVIPEPCTLSLMALGALFLRKRIS